MIDKQKRRNSSFSSRAGAVAGSRATAKAPFKGDSGDASMSAQSLHAENVGKFHAYRGAFLLATAMLLAWVLKGFLLPLSVGAIFAVVMHPLMNRLERPIGSRGWRAAFITAGFIVAFLIPIGIIGVLGADAALEKIHDFQESGGSFSNLSASGIMRSFGITALLKSASSWLPVSEAQVRSYLVRGLGAAVTLVTGAIQGWVADLPGIFFANVVVVFAIYSFLVDGPRAVAFLKKNSFFARAPTARILRVVSSVCQSTIAATLVTGLAQTAIVLFACLITGTPNALLISLVSFIFSFLPVVGTAPVTVSLAIWYFTHGSPGSGIIFLSTIAVVGVADNLIRPMVLKGGGEMHPLVAFVAAFGGLDVMGFYGLFVGPVIAGLFFAVLPVAVGSFGEGDGSADGSSSDVAPDGRSGA